MASSGNFPVLNTLYRGQRGTDSNNYGNITDGNRDLKSSSSADAMQISSIEMLNSGKWYWEWCVVSPGGDRMMHSGVADSDRGNWDYAGSNSVYGQDTNEKSIHFHTYNQSVKKNGTDAGVYTGSNSTPSNGDVFGIALDIDNRKFYVHKNNTYYASGNPATGANPGATWSSTDFVSGFTPYFTVAGGTDANGVINFGQDSSFNGQKTAQTNADGNGFGNFFYAPPSDFLSICSANLPISSNIDPAQTDDNIPSKNFNVLSYASTGAASYTGLGFQPDLVWVKWRGGDQGNGLFDSSRGTSKVLQSDSATAEATSSGLTSFDSDGFTMGTYYNQSTRDYVAWCWRANGGTTTSFSDNINGNYQANVAGGFSIISYTGTGSTGYVTHGLGATPNFILSKDRGASYGWNVYLKSGGTVHSGYDSQLYLDSANDLATNQQVNVVPDSTKITMAGNEQINKSTNTYIMYAWADVAGYQKFGIYEGNGNADGPFVYTGFKPRMLFVKDLDRDENWVTFDTARDTVNTLERGLFWNATSAESTGSGSGFDIDALANGFKLRCSHDNLNGSSTYIFGAWADVPFKYNNTHP